MRTGEGKGKGNEASAPARARAMGRSSYLRGRDDGVCWRGQAEARHVRLDAAEKRGDVHGARVVEPKPKGDTVLDFSKTFTVGGVEVTKPDGERVIDFSRGAAPLDILTGDAAAPAPDETGVAESKKDDPPKSDDASR